MFAFPKHTAIDLYIVYCFYLEEIKSLLTF